MLPLQRVILKWQMLVLARYILLRMPYNFVKITKCCKLC